MSAPSRGRPNAGRTKSLPRIGEQYHAMLREIAEAKQCSLAEAVEVVCEAAIDAMEGRPIHPAHRRYTVTFAPFSREQLTCRNLK